DGDATVRFNARGDGFFKWGNVELDGSTVIAKVGDDGISLVEFDAEYDITLTNSTVEALGGDWWRDYNIALVDFDAGDDISLSDESTVRAKVYDDGDATVKFNARGEKWFNSGDINVEDSIVEAVVDEDGDATVEFDADNDINIDPSTISAIVDEDGDALVEFEAGDDINIAHSTVEAVDEREMLLSV
ncbi:unnamed protein product, partial [marine sediment metagenome]